MYTSSNSDQAISSRHKQLDDLFCDNNSTLTRRSRRGMNSCMAMTYWVESLWRSTESPNDGEWLGSDVIFQNPIWIPCLSILQLWQYCRFPVWSFMSEYLVPVYAYDIGTLVEWKRQALKMLSIWNLNLRRSMTYATPEQGPLLEYPPNIKYAESWLFLYNMKNQTYIFPYNASEYAL